MSQKQQGDKKKPGSQKFWQEDVFSSVGNQCSQGISPGEAETEDPWDTHTYTHTPSLQVWGGMCCKWISGGGEKEEERTAGDVEIFMVMRMWRKGDLGIEGFSWET